MKKVYKDYLKWVFREGGIVRHDTFTIPAFVKWCEENYER